MSKSSKSKKSKVPVIGDKEYAEYINCLKMGADGVEGGEKSTVLECLEGGLKNENETQKK
jgi:hypothetical protein